MKWLRVYGMTLFASTFSPTNVLPPIATRFFNMTPFNPITPKIKHMYKTRERGILWWSISHFQMASHKRTVRSLCQRRVRHAIRGALKDHGFDRDGRLLVFDAEGKILEKKEGLQGTLDIKLNERMFGAKYADVEHQAKLLIRHLRNMQLRPKKIRPTWNKPKEINAEQS